MSDPTTPAPTDTPTDTPAEPATVSPEMQAILDENERIKGQLGILLAETKAAKEAKRESDEAAADAAREKAEKDNDFKQLFESSQSESEKAKAELQALKDEIASGKLSAEAAKLAAQCTKNTGKAELLAEKMVARLQDVDGSFKVLDAAGNLTVSSFDDLKREMSALYPFLVDGVGSSGGGAQGGSSTPSQKSLGEMTATEEVAFANEHPERYAQMIKG